MKQRYLTKSRFVTATKCPRKLYYADRPDVCETKNLDNQFLCALAVGAFQVGELAKVYHPGGHEITTVTKKLLQRQRSCLSKLALSFMNPLSRSWCSFALNETRAFARA